MYENTGRQTVCGAAAAQASGSAGQPAAGRTGKAAAELVGHLVGFPVTLGGFKVDGEGEDGLFRYSHQIGALLFGLLATGVQLPAVGVIGNGGDHFNELVDQFGSKTGSVYIDLLKKIISQQPCI